MWHGPEPFKWFLIISKVAFCSFLWLPLGELNLARSAGNSGSISHSYKEAVALLLLVYVKTEKPATVEREKFA